MAFMEYAYEGKIPDDPMMRFGTALMRESIDRDRYAALSKKRKIAARKKPEPALLPAPEPSDDDDEYVVFRSCGKSASDDFEKYYYVLQHNR